MLSRRWQIVRMAGFTAIELMTAIALLAVLLGIGVPSMVDWVRNNKVRVVANALQSGIRSAQTEALSRSQPVVLVLTNAVPTNIEDLSAVANGKFWATLAIPRQGTSETGALLSTGALGDVADGVTITGPAAICFSAIGRMTAHTEPGPTGATCSLPTTTAEVFDVDMTGAKRRLRVLVSIGGQVRMCDRDKDIATAPDGCPT